MLTHGIQVNYTDGGTLTVSQSATDGDTTVYGAVPLSGKAAGDLAAYLSGLIAPNAPEMAKRLADVAVARVALEDARKGSDLKVVDVTADVKPVDPGRQPASAP